MTANSLTTVSLEPLLLLCCLRRGAAMGELIQAAGCFGVSILSRAQEPLARHFANPRRAAGAAQFDNIAWYAGEASGAPLLDGALAAIECDVHRVLPAGDHLIFLAGVLDLERSERDDPLLFFRGGYRELNARTPTPPTARR
jgi:flavin reductase (DIM6/NTAB) family NADH-FMN oxidoreductase RutF